MAIDQAVFLSVVNAILARKAVIYELFSICGGCFGFAPPQLFNLLNTPFFFIFIFYLVISCNSPTITRELHNLFIQNEIINLFDKCLVIRL